MPHFSGSKLWLILTEELRLEDFLPGQLLNLDNKWMRILSGVILTRINCIYLQILIIQTQCLLLKFHHTTENNKAKIMITRN